MWRNRARRFDWKNRLTSWSVDLLPSMESLALLLLGGYFGFSALATPGRVAKRAESALHRQFPGAQVGVEVQGKRGRDVVNGRFKTIRISLANLSFASLPVASGADLPANDPAPAKRVKVGHIGHFELDLKSLQFGDLPVERVNVSFDDVRYDFGALKNHSELRLLSFSNGRIALAVRGSSLGSLFSIRAPEISDPKVEVRGGEIILSGTRDVLGTPTSVEVRGPVVARGQNIEIGDARVSVAGTALPPTLANPITRGINPLFRFDPQGKGPFLLHVSSIQSEDGLIQIQGELSLRPIPAPDGSTAPQGAN